jgi:hypothetical protein
MPLSLTDEEMRAVQGLALPIEHGRHGAFLQACAEALADNPVRGEGAAHQLGRVIQRQFWTPPQLSDAGVVAPEHRGSRPRR